MTFNEVLEKYGDVKLTFSYYYKYQFHYVGYTEDGTKISASVGGDSSDIYRHEVHNNETQSLSVLFPHSVEITKDGNTIVSLYDIEE